MKTLTMPMASIQKKYGITEKKKAELDALANKVLDAQFLVEELQAVVASLTVKSAKFQGFLDTATANKALALNNKVLVDSVVQNALTLYNNSQVAFDEVSTADSSTKVLANALNTVISKLIYTAEVVDKLSIYVIRQKALNPLISDELVAMINTAGTDANNAVALTLVALKAVFTAQATCLESEAAFALEYTEATKLYQILTGTDKNGKKDVKQTSIVDLIYKAYTYAEGIYNQSLVANTDTTQQLYNAIADLNTAQIKLKSLQAGLAAGNAAALAS
jgi:hypothetical protein